jgi:hypothetical protein
MAFKGRGIPEVDFADLLVTLLKSKARSADYPLFQTIEQLIKKSQQSRAQINSILNSFIGNIRITDDTDLSAILTLIANINNILTNATFWTENDESLLLAASRMAVAGVGMSFDYSVPNIVTLNATTGAGSVYYTPLTDGNVDETDLIFSLGSCIMVAVPI